MSGWWVTTQGHCPLTLGNCCTFLFLLLHHDAVLNVLQLGVHCGAATITAPPVRALHFVLINVGIVRVILITAGFSRSRGQGGSKHGHCPIGAHMGGKERFL